MEKSFSEAIAKSGLTKDEQKIAEHIVRALNGFNKLEQTHPDDKEIFTEAIHRLQTVLGLRILRRDYPEFWLTVK
ncbi:hypothetical protein AAXB25_15045 [Paenibacillus lautus]|uniref:hypothetical protein n=1 Tax=Paenibacillus lautus TaxID=1401 RepID=UPI003D2984B1